MHLGSRLKSGLLVASRIGTVAERNVLRFQGWQKKTEGKETVMKMSKKEDERVMCKEDRNQKGGLIKGGGNVVEIHVQISHKQSRGCGYHYFTLLFS